MPRAYSRKVPSASVKAKFGEFEFNVFTGELRRGGEPVRLQSQPARVLAILVEHAGQVVTRDALREAIWGGDTFVDFDKGLNFAIAQIRTALGDSAAAPSFVRTLPKRGYQFIAPIEVADAANRIDPESAALNLDAGAPRPRVEPGVDFGSALRLTVAVVAILGVTAAAVWWATRSTGDPHTLAVVAFDNETGNSELDRYAQNVTDALVAELTTGARGRLQVIGNAAALRVPRSQRDLVAIGRSLHAGHIVLGQVQRDQGKLRILAHLIRLPEQTHLWVVRIEQFETEPLGAAAKAATRISEQFLGKL
jgi:DNA-binding winged helix-turn-helix (wHTH) protein/TolB-like protein